MKLQPYIEKLNSSSEFKEFQKKYDGAFIVAGFFVLDLEMGKNLHQIDYYVPSKKKIAAFTLDDKVTMQLLDLLNNKVPEKLDIKTKIDLDQIKGILEDEMKNRSIAESIKKIIAVLQNLDGKKIWNLNCILSGMGILNAHVEDESRTVLKMEKKSLMDIMKKMSVSEFKQMQAQQKTQQGQVQVQTDPAAEKDVEIQEKLKKLNALEQEIEKEKAELQQEEVKLEKEETKVKLKTNPKTKSELSKTKPKKK